MRLHILGGSGSGKTYISDLISNETAVPHYDLDDIFWDKNANTYGVKAEPTVRDFDLAIIVSQPKWIIEGIYLDSWVDPVLSAADSVLVLQPPLDVQEQRIWHRFERQKLGLTSAKKEVTRESLDRLLEYNRLYNTRILPAFLSSTKYREKVTIVNDPDQSLRFVDTFRQL